ncbi:hypothetical protein BDA96_10G272800 [Sorghum bicolor]|uniref:Uncharacterized protein n=1 Tax=Sorghum bicolor TaxID=4558 RepID=A0A921Q6S5_SORBI|nr:hypothetical protein BDA96_10G272800 [Sorghum bicolor]
MPLPPSPSLNWSTGWRPAFCARGDGWMLLLLLWQLRLISTPSTACPKALLRLIPVSDSRPIRLGPEEIDRRERAPGAAAGMERMPSPPRARFSFCQPLSRPGPTPPRPAGAVCVLLGATGASGAADATTEAGSKPRAPLARWKLCHAVVARREMHDTHAARGRRLLQAVGGLLPRKRMRSTMERMSQE